MYSEPTITINGNLLSVAQAMTVRVAISNFYLTLADGLGEDETGKGICEGYKARIVEINQLMAAERPESKFTVNRYIQMKPTIRNKFDEISAAVACPTCGAPRGYRCMTPGGLPNGMPHARRRSMFTEQAGIFD